MPSLIDLIPRKFMAAQLRKPSGLFGRLVVAPALNRHNAAINAATLTALSLSPADRVLEVGFGGGALLAQVLPLVPAGRVWGADFSVEMVERGRKRFAAGLASGRLQLETARVEAMPFPSSSVGKACSVNTLYFWEDPAAALAEIRRVLEPGGLLVIGFSPRATLEKLPVTRHGFTLYEPAAVGTLLCAAGFDAIDLREGRGPTGPFVCAVARKPR
jgi:arsenite methyltransferase